MSAIAAFWSLDGAARAAETVMRMTEALAIHGPDAAGWSGGAEVALGWRGRTVLPEDRFDQQPRAGAGAALLVADCRIDNRDELRDRLELEDGASPLPDSAVILAAYEAWGEGCVEHLVGDFSFAVWDPRRRRLFAARDPMGARPLYFHRGRGFVALASMPKGLFALEEVPRRLNHDKLLDILLLLAETDTSTFYEGVERIPPGHTLVVTEASHRLQPYWRLDDVPPLVLRSDGEYQEAFEATFEEAVRCRLRAVDGPVAAQLSGGWDSSSVTALAAEALARQGRPLLALTATTRDGFSGAAPPGRFVDEERYAALTAARYGNVEHVVLRDGPGLLDDLDAFTSAAEIPVLNLCNQRWLMSLFRTAHGRGARVVLSARGGNMTISYRGLHRLSELVRSGRWLALRRELRALRTRPGATWRTGLRLALEPLLPGALFQGRARRARAYHAIARHTAFDPDRCTQPVVEARARACGWDLSARPWRNGRALRVAALGRVDEAPFNYGFEAVTGVQPVDPTLDRRLVELCLSIPDAQYFRDGQDRRLLRRMMAHRLPPEFLAERRKGLQAADWYEVLREDRDAIADELDRCAQSATAAGLLDLSGMRDDLRALPDDGWEQPATIARYRLRLLRGTAMGGFIRRVEGVPAPAAAPAPEP